MAGKPPLKVNGIKCDDIEQFIFVLKGACLGSAMIALHSREKTSVKDAVDATVDEVMNQTCIREALAARYDFVEKVGE